MSSRAKEVIRVEALSKYAEWSKKLSYNWSKRRRNTTASGGVRNGLRMRTAITSIVMHCLEEIQNGSNAKSSGSMNMDVHVLFEFGLRQHIMSTNSRYNKLHARGGNRTNKGTTVRSDMQSDERSRVCARALKTILTKPTSLMYVRESARMFMEMTQYLLDATRHAIESVHYNDLRRHIAAVLLSLGVAWNTRFGGVLGATVDAFIFFRKWVRSLVVIIKKRTDRMGRDDILRLHLEQDDIPHMSASQLTECEGSSGQQATDLSMPLDRFNNSINLQIRGTFKPLKKLPLDKLNHTILNIAAHVGSGIAAKEEMVNMATNACAIMTIGTQDGVGPSSFGTCFKPTLDTDTPIRDIYSFIENLGSGCLNRREALTGIMIADHAQASRGVSEHMTFASPAPLKALVDAVLDGTNGTAARSHLEKFGVGIPTMNKRERLIRQGKCMTTPAHSSALVSKPVLAEISAPIIDQISSVAGALWVDATQHNAFDTVVKTDDDRASQFLLAAVITMSTDAIVPDSVAAFPMPLIGSEFAARKQGFSE